MSEKDREFLAGLAANLVVEAERVSAQIEYGTTDRPADVAALIGDGLSRILAAQLLMKPKDGSATT